MTVHDLLVNINPYKRTFLNYAKVFGIDYSIFYVGKPFLFEERQEIRKELYDYFLLNKDFIEIFYNDWHTAKTIEDLRWQTGLESKDILTLFRDDKVFMNRSRLTNIQIGDSFRFYSRYQIIELLTNYKVISRP
jgi:hypothetical protein